MTRIAICGSLVLLETFAHLGWEFSRSSSHDPWTIIALTALGTMPAVYRLGNDLFVFLTDGLQPTAEFARHA